MNGTLLSTLVLVAWYLVLVPLAIHAGHRLYLIRLLRRHAARKPSTPACGDWPGVTVQLPLYNEPGVVERLLGAVASLRYSGALEIQVLDDSTDETTLLARREVERLRQQGLEIQLVHREHRAGYKAGALAHGMSHARHDLLVVFDADFVPPPEFLERTIPFFQDPRVGMVQARWTHLNREESLLTRLQALYLDGHFGVESAARFLAGRFFNFNGTAGVWRRQAIESAGGWSHRTVTEDLDLSYRAQLRRWKFVFLSGLEVPAELPGTLDSFHGQQSRWAKGSMQTARELLPRILRSSVPLAVKIESAFHLTSNLAYPLCLLAALLVVPSALIRTEWGVTPLLLVDGVVLALSTGSFLLFYIEGQRSIGRRAPPLGDLLLLVPFGVGLSIVNSAAVLEGLFRAGGHFNRTPKRGGAARIIRRERPPRFPAAELLMALFLFSCGVILVRERLLPPLPFLLFFLGGYTAVAIGGMLERFAWYRSSAP